MAVDTNLASPPDPMRILKRNHIGLAELHGRLASPPDPMRILKLGPVCIRRILHLHLHHHPIR